MAARTRLITASRAAASASVSSAMTAVVASSFVAAADDAALGRRQRHPRLAITAVVVFC